MTVPTSISLTFSFILNRSLVVFQDFNVSKIDQKQHWMPGGGPEEM
jgi:hypothetical protein